MQPSLRTDSGGVGGLVAVSIGDDYYFPGYDNNGNVIGYWDEDGSIVAEYAYDAFGNTIASSGSMASVFPHRFSTKYYDSETDLYYYGYRYYSPSLGRWISRDSVEENECANLYLQCQNNPIQWFDIQGDRTYSEDLYTSLILNLGVAYCRTHNRPLTASFLSYYLDSDNSGLYTMNVAEVATVMRHPQFQQEVLAHASDLIIRHGEGAISYEDSAFSNFRFYFNRDGDLWSAFNDIHYKVSLNGTTTKEADSYVFRGMFKVFLWDNYSFTDPHNASREPFNTQGFEFLPDHIKHMPEQRFRDLETRGWVKPFDVEGIFEGCYRIKADHNHPSAVLDTYNK